MAPTTVDWTALGLPREVLGVDQLLVQRARNTPGAIAFRFVDREDDGPVEWTYAQLHARAGAIARSLERGGVLPGAPVVLLYPQGLEYIAAFFGSLYVGAIPVPLLPPRSKRGWGRVRTVLQTSGASRVLTTAALEASVRDALGGAAAQGELRYFVTDPLSEGDDFLPAARPPDAVAFLQYTSGSTASPRGVVIGHDNLLANLWTIWRAFEIRSDSSVLSWLPLYHDMGLIGGVLEPLFAGIPGTLLSPIAFVQRPLLWLEAIGRFGATISGAPNFAYRMCLERATDQDIARLDLRTWELAFCGAERISAKVMGDFADTFAWAGFDREALFPCYGLAESTLFVSGGPKGRGARVASVSRSALAAGRAGPPRAPSDAARLVSCGLLPGEHEVRIVEPETGRELPEGSIGEIWIAGSSVARGYWRLEPGAAGAMRTEGRFLRSGDLGFVRGRELYVTGRSKELLIVRGANLYPEDLESAAEASHKALVPGGSAAFGVLADDCEEIALVMEVTKGETPPYPEIVAAVRAAISETFQQRAHTVVLVRRGTIPRTTSGKTQRGLCKRQLEAGELHALYRESDPAASAERAGGDDQRAGPAPAGSEAAAPPGAPATAELASAPATAELARARSLLVERVAQMAGVQPAQVDLSRTAADYGWSSLSAASVAYEMERILGRTLGFERFFEDRSLDAVLEDLAATGRPLEPSPEPPALSSSRAQLTRGQMAIWAAERAVPGGHGYLIARAYRMPEDLDEDAWTRALAEVARRHPLLCTRIVEDDGACYFEILPSLSLGLERHHPRDLQGGAALRRVLSELAMRPLDLSAGPMLRASLVQTEAGHRVLLLTVHHIVSDFVSLIRVLEAWCAAYSALRAGEAQERDGAPAPGLAAPGAADLGVEPEAWRAPKEYWRANLAGELPVLALPHDYPRPRVHRQRGAHSHARASGVVSRLDAVAKQCGTTRFVVALAAYAAFLRRWTGQDELVIGTPVTQRRSPDQGRSVGFFPSFVPLRIAVPAGVAFRQLVLSVRAVVTSALRNAVVPFPEIVKVAGVVRDPGVHPLFQASFTMHEPPAGVDPDVVASALNLDRVPVRVRGLTMETYEIDDDGCQSDFMLFTGVVGDDLVFQSQADVDLFETASARAMTSGCAQLLSELVRDPEADIDGVAFGGPSIVHGAALPVPAGAAPTITRRIARWAERDPAAVAVADRRGSLGYGDLLLRAGELAETLRSAGVRPGEPVGLCAEERSVDGVVAMVGILMAGAWFVPLSSHLPTERLAFVREDLRARFVVAGRPHMDRYVAAGFEAIDAVARRGDARRAISAHRASGGDAIAYAIYTSGSTGTPKAVLVEHAQVLHFADAVAARYGIGPEDRMVSCAPWSFDAVIFEIPVFLILGGRVYVTDEEERRSPVQKLALLREQRATVHNDTPVAFRGVIQEMIEGARLGQPLPAVKTWVVGGEATTPKDVERLRAAYAAAGQEPAAFINSYGPTEATVFVTEHACDGADVGRVRVPIGVPLPGMTALVLDEQKRPVPWGARGHLYVSGPAVARGYWGQPELTGRAFFPTLDASAPPATRMYRTGDVVRVRPDGLIDFLGRADRQVKLRGHRIELAEVELAFTKQEGVAQALVTTRVVAGSPALVAYVVPSPGASPSGRQLRERLLALLPAYMVPWIVAVIDAFPLGATGKIAEHALPAPELFVDRTAPREAASPVEAALVTIVGEVLGARVGPDDHFFELGGDSITALRVVTRMRKEGVQLEIRELLEHPRLSELAAVIGKASLERRTGPSDAEVARHARRPAPIHEWFARRSPADLRRFVQWVRLRLPPGDPVALAESALRGLARRHGAFAQGFARDPDGALTRVELPEDRRWRLVPGCTRARSIEDLIDAEIAQGTAFVPERGPLLAGFLFEGDEPEAHRAPGSTSSAELVVAAHHFAVDVYAWHVLLEDIEAIFRGDDPGVDDFDGPRFVAAVAGVAARARASGAVERWDALLRDFDPAAAYAALETTATASRSVRRSWQLSEELTAALVGTANRALRTKPQDLLLASLGRALCEVLSISAAPIHVEHHGRDEEVLGISTGVGWCATWVPHVVRSSEDALESIAAMKDARAELAYGGLDFLPLLVDGDLSPEGVSRFLEPGVQFNFLGTVVDRGGVREFGLHQGSPLSRIEATALIRAGRLALEVCCPPETEEIVRRIGELWHHELQASVRALGASRRGLYSRSDFPWVPVPPAVAEALSERLAGAAQPGKLHAIEEIVPLNALQRLMLVRHLASPAEGGTSGHVHLLVEGPLRLEELESRYRAVVAEHPVLRSVFDWKTLDEPVQIVLAAMPTSIAFSDLSGEALPARQGALDALVRRARSSTIDLAHGPILRVHVVRTAAQEHHLVLTTDHVAIDGWSLAAVTGRLLSGRAASVREAQGYSLGALYRPSRPEATATWVSRLAGLPLPPRSAPAAPARGTITLEEVLPPRVAEALRARARTTGVALSSLLVAAWGRVMMAWTGSPHALVGLTTSGRTSHHEAVGAFIQNVPVLVTEGARAFSDVHASVSEAMEHGDFDPAALADALGYPMDVPLFESSLVIQNYPTDRLEEGGALRARVVSASDDTAFPLTAIVYPEPDLRIRLHARPGAAEPDDVRALLAAFSSLLARIADDPGCELSGIEPPREALPKQRRILAPSAPVLRAAPARARAAEVDSATHAIVRAVLVESFGELPDLMERNFFDLGGSSLTMLRLKQRLSERVGRDLPVTLFFRAGNGRRLVEAMQGSAGGGAAARAADPERRAGAASQGHARFAIIGMAGRFPGARSVGQLWENLRAGKEAIRRLQPAELGPEGQDAIARDPERFVGACSELEDVERFDAALFDIAPREAELLDPQQRVLLEAAYEALENAGYNPRSAETAAGGERRKVGVFASSTLSSYLIYNLLSRRDILAREGAWRLAVANEKDCGPSRVAYKLGLTGPAIAVQTACSSSLVAVHMACASLASGECDMALAGGVSIRVPQRAGYSTRDAEILSQDGRCAAFGAGASGTVLGDGAGIVVLKRLEDAIRDRDPIWAVVLGSMINNDGARKAGYTAPSVEGQREVLVQALDRAGARADSIQLVEAHGTGTLLGDPIEFEALTEAFRTHTDRRAFCALGSIKSNLGHLDNAAGIAGLIKCVLALHHGEIPPTLHADPVSPALDVEASPFYVASASRPWPRTEGRRRAAVSSFGIGGTNAHAILEAWEEASPSDDASPGSPELLLLSARTEEGLAELGAEWARYLESEHEGPLRDPLRTSQHGREHFPLRRAVVGATAGELRDALREPRPARAAPATEPPLVVVFPGQGSQYRGMLGALRDGNAAYREAEDACLELLGGDGDALVRALRDRDTDLTPTRFAQVAIFVASYAMLRAIEDAGVRPVGYIGHSVGELAAAVASGALDLPAALAIVRVRGEVMDDMPPGAMLAVSVGKADIQRICPPDLDLAAVNGASATVVAGPPAEVEAFQELLARRGIAARRLVTAHAFHSRWASPAAGRFLGRLESSLGLLRGAPHGRGTVFSSVTGGEITAAALRDARHWRDQIESPVQFHEAVCAAKQRFPDAIFVEVGPGQALTTLLRGDQQAAVPLGRHPARGESDLRRWLSAIGELWELGVAIDFERVSPPASFRRRRVPGAIFERRRFWIDPPERAGAPEAPRPRAYVPSWRTAAPVRAASAGDIALFHVDERWMSALLSASAQAGRRVHDVSGGGDAEPLVRVEGGVLTVVYAERAPELERLHAFLRYLGRAARHDPSAVVRGVLVSRGGVSVRGEAVRSADWAFGYGSGLVAQMEIPNVRFRAVDIPEEAAPDEVAAALLTEIDCESRYPLAAWRGTQRFELEFAPLGEPRSSAAGGAALAAPQGALLARGAVVLITGGLGAIGRRLAAHLAERHGATVVIGTRRKDIDDIVLPGGQRIPCVTLDVADPASIAAALSHCEERFGPVAGIFHAAGVDKPLAYRALDDLALEDFDNHFATKVAGTRNLERAIEGRSVRFVALFSSLSGYIGGLGCGAHAAANRFLDAFAGVRGGVRWLSVAWDRWLFEDDAIPHTAESRRLALSPDAALELLDALLSEDTPPSVIVSTEDPIRRIAARVGGRPAAEDASGARPAQHERPLLRTSFVPAASETELKVVEILGEILGIEGIGVLDDLLELGASSLHSAQIAERIRAAFDVQLSLKDVFEARTARVLSTSVETALLAKGDPDELRRLLEEIE
uniref:Polyketide synthase n=1 Tax=Sorangium cellulosum TaxID=56 RepID=A0A3S7UZP8_SORCE|nr:polyketide synthase [Sorangium cellulosum]